MRLLRYEDAGAARLGAVDGDRVVELEALAATSPGGPLPTNLLELIDLGGEGLQRVRVLLGELTDESRPRFTRPLSEVRLLAPLDPPRENVFAVGRNYQEHAEESARARGETVQPPTVFTKAQSSINGPHDDIPLHAAHTSQLDWEAELGVVIGRVGRDIPVERALDYVFGFTVVNDVSARDLQHNWGGQFFKGKSLDGCCPIGPWIVTADEIPDPQNLRVMLRVNGVTKQDASTRDMIHSVAELIARLSEGMTLLPGNLIATGTPAGVGMGRTPQEWLKAGDVMETEIEGIGLLRNRIVGS